MLETALMPQTALKYDVQVTETGLVELPVPFAPGERLVVFVVKKDADPLDDLLDASQSSLDFWDNAYDDEDWNDA